MEHARRDKNCPNSALMPSKIIFIHPPVSKPSEPPAGIAKLAGCLQAGGISCRIIDANLEGLLYLLTASARETTAADRWTTRARKHLDANIAALRNGKIYLNPGSYRRVVADINRLYRLAGESFHADLTLADYHDHQLTPVKSGDLLRAAENPHQNPFYPYFSLRLPAVLEEEPRFLGFSLNYLSQALCTFAMIGFVKKKNPRQKIILGGSLATSWIKITGSRNIFAGLVDEMVAGKGEKKLLELLGGRGDVSDMPPAYHDFPLEDYLAPVTILPYSASSGCYWQRCSFCPERAEDNPYQPQALNRAIAHLQLLCRESNPGLIHIVDNAISPALLSALAVNHFSAPWYGFTRIIPQLTDEDFCRSLHKNGCVLLKLGIESGDQKVLDKLGKGIDLPTVSRALNTLKRTGISTYVYLLFGTPPENEESALKTLNFVLDHRDCISFLNLAIFNLPVLSDDAQTLSTHDFYAGDLSLYKSFVHPLGWQRAAVRKFLEKTFKKQPAVAEIIRRTPDYFTSNHAPFFRK